MDLILFSSDGHAWHWGLLWIWIHILIQRKLGVALGTNCEDRGSFGIKTYVNNLIKLLSLPTKQSTTWFNHCSLWPSTAHLPNVQTKHLPVMKGRPACVLHVIVWCNLSWLTLHNFETETYCNCKVATRTQLNCYSSSWTWIVSCHNSTLLCRT